MFIIFELECSCECVRCRTEEGVALATEVFDELFGDGRDEVDERRGFFEKNVAENREEILGVITSTEERGVELPDDVLDGARFGDGRENIAGLDAFDDFVFDSVFRARANACARAISFARARSRATIRGIR